MSIQFNGSSDKVDWGDLDALDGLTKLTISAWMYFDSTAGDFGYMLSKESGSGSNIFGWVLTMKTSDANLHVIARNNDASNGHFVTTLDALRHYLYVFDGTQSTDATRLKCWDQGAQQTLTFVGTIPASIGANAAPMRYGAHPLDTNFAKGRIAEVGIWPGVAITHPTIIAHLAAGACPLFYQDLGLRFHDHGRPTVGEALGDMIGGATPTITGTTFAAHPTITYPARHGALLAGARNVLVRA